MTAAKFTLIISLMLTISCSETMNNDEQPYLISYNLIEHGNDIYAIKQKDVDYKMTSGKNYEAVYWTGDKVIKIERYDENGNLSDEFSVAAVTSFEYDNEDRVKYLRYFDKNGEKWEDDVFGYWSVEYIYDEKNRVRMEIYRDSESKFLGVPRDNSGNIAKINFLAPVLTYEYIEDKLRIKALDQNFNLLKEVLGEKPCIPFIDCGEND